MMKTEADGRSSCPHAPGANLDYSIDWGRALGPGEKVMASEWQADAGIVLSRDSVSASGLVTTVFAAGGVARQAYVLTNKVTTTAGRVDSRTITLRCGVR